MRSLLIATIILRTAIAATPQLKPGVERWPIKTSVPAGASKTSTVPLADLLGMQDAAGVTKDDKRYQSARIPAQSGATFKEGDLLTTTGYLHLVAGESDGDYHIQISDSGQSGDHCLIVE